MCTLELARLVLHRMWSESEQVVIMLVKCLCFSVFAAPPPTPDNKFSNCPPHLTCLVFMHVSPTHQPSCTLHFLSLTPDRRGLSGLPKLLWVFSSDLIHNAWTCSVWLVGEEAAALHIYEWLWFLLSSETDGVGTLQRKPLHCRWRCTPPTCGYLYYFSASALCLFPWIQMHLISSGRVDCRWGLQFNASSDQRFQAQRLETSNKALNSCCYSWCSFSHISSFSTRRKIQSWLYINEGVTAIKFVCNRCSFFSGRSLSYVQKSSMTVVYLTQPLMKRSDWPERFRRSATIACDWTGRIPCMTGAEVQQEHAHLLKPFRYVSNIWSGLFNLKRRPVLRKTKKVSGKVQCSIWR